MESSAPKTSTAKKKGICYRCMFDSHKHCYGDSGKTDCMCQHMNHNLDVAFISLRMDPDRRPVPFPEDPTDGKDRFYFLPADAPPKVTLQ